MKYRITDRIIIPFRVICNIKSSHLGPGGAPPSHSHSHGCMRNHPAEQVICNIKSETKTRLEMELVLKSLVEERLFAINIQVRTSKKMTCSRLDRVDHLFGSAAP